MRCAEKSEREKGPGKMGGGEEKVGLDKMHAGAVVGKKLFFRTVSLTTWP